MAYKYITQEEKSKAYDEALELMKDCIPDENGLVHVRPEEIFHELNKESEDEDERIRKELIGFLRNIPNSNYTCEEMALWLEKQGEKTADKIEPFDKYDGLTDFERTLADICIGWIGEELGWQQYIKDNADVLLKIAIKKFNSVQDTLFKQKPAWSEEDDVMINKLLAVVKLYYDRSGDDLDKQSCISFLKSLKDKVQPQPKQEWSEEDEIARKALINLVEMYYGGCIDKTEKKRLLNLLKSLRPQKQWKPTKGMLDALRLVQAEWHLETPETSENLRYLYQELKQIYYDGN